VNKLLTIANAIHDALRPIDQPGRIIQYANFLDEPHIAQLWFKNAHHSFTARALFNQESHLHEFLDQWRTRQWIDLRSIRTYPARSHPDRVRLLYRDAELGIHVFKGDLPDDLNPSNPKTLLIGFKAHLRIPDFCHTFDREHDALRFMQRWLAEQERQVSADNHHEAEMT
jgi:hypothetical protein